MNESLVPTLETTHLLRWSLPLWLTLGVWLGLFLIVVFLYRLERGSASAWMRLTLAVLRFSLLSIAFIMLTNWTIERYESTRPEVLILLDTSDSMNSPSSDASLSDPSRLELALESLQSLTEREQLELERQFQVRLFSIGEALRPLPKNLLQPTADIQSLKEESRLGSNSRLGSGIMEAIQQRAGHELAAIVLLSDGINTDGTSLSSASELARSSAIPIFSAITGHIDQSPDLNLSNLQIEKDAFLGDRLAAQLSVRASNVPESNYRVSVINTESQVNLANMDIRLGGDGTTETIADLSMEASAPGLLPLRFTIQPADGETNLANNSIETTLHVHDQPLKVLLAFGKPNYEFRFLKDFLERAQTSDGKPVFDLQSVLYSGDAAYVDQDQTAERSIPLFASDLQNFDIFLLGPLDYSLLNSSTLEGIVAAVNQAGAGCMFICDQPELIQSVEKTPLLNILPVRGSSRRSKGNEFSKVVLSELGARAAPLRVTDDSIESQAIWQSLPPLSNWARVNTVVPGAQLWLTTNADQTEESFPLLATQYVGRGRVAAQLTDETYRWTNWQGNDAVYQRYWGQMLRWLARGRLASDEPVSELVVTPQVVNQGASIEIKLLRTASDPRATDFENPTIEIFSTDQLIKSLSLSPPLQAERIRTYAATDSSLEPATYRAVYRNSAGQSIAKDFVVTPNNVEQRNTPMDLPALEQLSQRTGGKLWMGKEEIRNGLQQLPKGQTMRVKELPPITLWNHPLLVASFIILISLEWLLRRQSSML